MKDIKGYEGLYAITSCGKVWSYRRQNFKKASINNNGYYHITLCKDGVKKDFLIHRLVAETYISNPEGKATVNHKDENKLNNSVNNLEWMTQAEQIIYGTRTARARKSVSKPVFCVELNRVFESVSIAAEYFGLFPSNISSCCRGRIKTSGGYHWEYVDKEGK